jgi:hypothetical protein
MAKKKTITLTIGSEQSHAACVAFLALIEMEERAGDAQLSEAFDGESQLLKLWKAHRKAQIALRAEYKRIHIKSCERAGIRPRSEFKSLSAWSRSYTW